MALFVGVALSTYILFFVSPYDDTGDLNLGAILALSLSVSFVLSLILLFIFVLVARVFYKQVFLLKEILYRYVVFNIFTFIIVLGKLMQIIDLHVFIAISIAFIISNVFITLFFPGCDNSNV